MWKSEVSEQSKVSTNENKNKMGVKGKSVRECEEKKAKFQI